MIIKTLELIRFSFLLGCFFSYSSSVLAAECTDLGPMKISDICRSAADSLDSLFAQIEKGEILSVIIGRGGADDRYVYANGRYSKPVPVLEILHTITPGGVQLHSTEIEVCVDGGIFSDPKCHDVQCSLRMTSGNGDIFKQFTSSSDDPEETLECAQALKKQLEESGAQTCFVAKHVDGDGALNPCDNEQ